MRLENPLYRYVQRLLDITLKSQKPFDILYSSLWQLLKDKGIELENYDDIFSISLHNYNIKAYSLFKIKSEICKKYSDKESDDKVKDLLIAAKAYYEKLFNPSNLIELGYCDVVAAHHVHYQQGQHGYHRIVYWASAIIG